MNCPLIHEPLRIYISAYFYNSFLNLLFIFCIETSAIPLIFFLAPPGGTVFQMNEEWTMTTS